MKKLLLFVAALGFLTSCSEQEEERISVEAIQFVSTAGNFPVYEDFATSYVDVQVGVTTKSSSDRTFTVGVDTENSTATSSQYMLESTSVTIPAGSYIGTVRVYGYYDEIGPDDQLSLILTLSEEDGKVVVGKTTHTLTMYQACATNLVLMNINFDGYASEVTWQLYDASNNLLAEDAGNYFDGQSTYSEEFCLDAGSYRFEVQDSFGDGLSFPSNGTISFTNTTTNTSLGSVSGDYGFGTTLNFTIN